MEAPEGNNNSNNSNNSSNINNNNGSSGRQSGILSLINREHVDRINTERPYTSAPTMATTTIVSPTTTSMYSNHPPPYSAGWSHPPQHLVSGLSSPPEPRRISDNNELPHPTHIQTSQQRQSLPSIHEALSAGSKPNPYASPVSASLSHSQHQLPFSSQQTQSIPRSYPPENAPYQAQLGSILPRQPSPPGPGRSQSSPFGRSDSTPVSFAESGRHGSSHGVSGPVPNPYAQRPYESPRYEQDSSHAIDGYTHNPAPPPQQRPYQFGSRASVPHSGHFNDPRYPLPTERTDQPKPFVKEKLTPLTFQQTVARGVEVWGVSSDLQLIDEKSTILQEWSRNYSHIALEQHRQIPDRMPTAQQCDDMLNDAHTVVQSIARLKNTIRDQQYAESEQRLREHGGKHPREYDEEMSMYGDDLMKGHGFGSSDGKKRRGRAAPPGRCHSCNREETPEWRRGPDGARTLCNACGLHYAKLTRKNNLKLSQGTLPNGSSIRPKSMDDHSPRPF